MTNCPNCGAPVDPAADRCAYCETPYPQTRRTPTAIVIGEPCTLRIDSEAIARLVAEGITTPNQARRLMGLREV